MKQDVTPSNKLPFTVDDMRHFAGEAWGPLGVSIVDKWCEFNAAYFDGVLRPVPLVITHAQPFGKLLAFCSYNPDSKGRTITLNIPKKHIVLVADINTLIHEMVHQFLFERGEPAEHAGALGRTVKNRPVRWQCRPHQCCKSGNRGSIAATKGHRPLAT